MIDYEDCYEQLSRQPKLKRWLNDSLIESVKTGLQHHQWKNLPTIDALIDALPTFSWLPTKPDITKLNNAHVSIYPDAKVDHSHPDRQQLYQTLQSLKPWRKGPFNLFGLEIDTEWRSDWKWSRLEDNGVDFSNKTVLDIGCGNGYYLWRMLGAGAKLALGIDPSPRFILQWQIIKHYLAQTQPDLCRAFVLPIGVEALPDALQAFDMTVSMGVFYHRKSPIEHLAQLRSTLRPGGQLILETLVVDGDVNAVLVPQDRYAKMPNVWFLPSTAALELWLHRCRFKDIRLLDLATTTTDEQRKTDWIDSQSLPDFLDPNDSTKTIEGYPAPKRALFTATC